MFKFISKNALLLAAVAAITTGTVALTEFTTEASIIEAQHQALKDALFELLPDQQHNNDLLNDYARIRHPLLALKSPQDVFFARRDNQPLAAIIPAIATEGYGGTISMLVGIRYDGTITGVRIIPPHNETPGLGDKIDIDKSDWILGFNGKSLNSPAEQGWKVKKDGGDFDQMTGATITPRAVVKAVYNTLLYFDHNKEQLFRDSLATQAQQAGAHLTQEYP
jgi:electron transport complex protein RnfG